MQPVSELKIQSTFFIWTWNQYPELRGFLYAIANGGLRDIVTANQLKASGLVKGTPDTHFVVPSTKYHTLYIEFKSATGTLTKEQKALIPRLRDLGHQVEVVSTVDDAKNIFNNYLKQTRFNYLVK